MKKEKLIAKGQFNISYPTNHLIDVDNNPYDNMVELSILPGQYTVYSVENSDQIFILHNSLANMTDKKHSIDSLNWKPGQSFSNYSEKRNSIAFLGNFYVDDCEKYQDMPDFKASTMFQDFKKSHHDQINILDNGIVFKFLYDEDNNTSEEIRYDTTYHGGFVAGFKIIIDNYFNSINRHFLDLCENGSLDSVRDFVQLHRNEIDIHYNKTSAFYCACYNENSEIIEYLMTSDELKKNVQMTEENLELSAFKLLYKHHFSVLEKFILSGLVRKTPFIEKSIVHYLPDDKKMIEHIFSVYDLNQKLTNELDTKKEIVANQYKNKI